MPGAADSLGPPVAGPDNGPTRVCPEPVYVCLLPMHLLWNARGSPTQTSVLPIGIVLAHQMSWSLWSLFRTYPGPPHEGQSWGTDGEKENSGLHSSQSRPSTSHSLHEEPHTRSCSWLSPQLLWAQEAAPTSSSRCCAACRTGMLWGRQDCWASWCFCRKACLSTGDQIIEAVSRWGRGASVP